MTYLAIALPSDPSARTARVAFERAQGRVYQRPDGSHVLAREYVAAARARTPRTA